MHVKWEDLGATPMAERRYSPQGMTYMKGKIIFANSWKNSKSRVYELDPQTMRSSRFFDMPAQAVHTSGLAFDGEHLFAVDYISNRCYQIDPEISFAKQYASVVGSFATGLAGTSACCFLSFRGKKYLVISDFRNSFRTYIVDAQEAIGSGSMAGAVLFSYQNEGFSQGLEWDGKFLYESENKFGTNVINQMSVARLRSTGKARLSIYRQFNAPHRGVEDLAWDGSHLYTSDEVSYHFYRTVL